ncbi:CRAL-TRIO domain-containing protein [Aspergillus ambiguus]|uniref:SEC14 family lipid-binding protein n=1 Tax=Aspergillus ambiguus TaxID=176160 RepID=UPI003CCD00B0
MTTNDSLNGLCEKEKLAFNLLSNLCAEKNLLDRPNGLADDDAPYAINDSTTLLRFLRARRLDPDAALQQFLEAAHFRKEKQTLDVYNCIRIEDFEAARNVYPHWIGRRTKHGLPICLTHIGNITKTTIQGWKDARYLNPNQPTDPSSSKDGDPTSLRNIELLQIGALIFDNITRFAIPVCAALPDRRDADTPLTSAVILADASTLTISQGFDLRVFARDLSSLLSTCYPEIIDKIIICNCPVYLGIIWKALKGWIDPVTAAKFVFLTPGEVYPALSEMIHDEDLPAQFGGKLEFQHGMLPDLDGGIRRALRCDRLVPGPIKCGFDEQGRMKLVAVGSVDGQLRNEHVATLEMEL